ncbi:MAG: hypothetical protein A2277_21765 [Desulfobacterales bacterium RIFOXYA12_FULL_46_15]|nr:MAG: hypothetical protein A2277_21765 [Desulfobacterales bacterium RIFOXYA12_FULL_46_15]
MPTRHSVPNRQRFQKRLRIYFFYDRTLLAKLSIYAWKVMSAYLKSVVSDSDAVIENRLMMRWTLGFCVFDEWH